MGPFVVLFGEHGADEAERATRLRSSDDVGAAADFPGTMGCRLRPCPEELIALLDMDPLHPGGAVCRRCSRRLGRGPTRVVLAPPQTFPIVPPTDLA